MYHALHCHRSFSVVVPLSWNVLPSALRNANSLSALKAGLKIHRFREAFKVNTLLLVLCTHRFILNLFSLSVGNLIFI